MLQANVLQAGKSSGHRCRRCVYQWLRRRTFRGRSRCPRYSGGNQDTGSIIGGGLLGAAVETAAGAFVQDVTYTAITDIQVSERATDGDV